MMVATWECVYPSSAGARKEQHVERYNEPPAWRDEGNRLTVTTGPDSDFWRVTHDGFVRDTGASLRHDHRRRCDRRGVGTWRLP